MVRVVVAFSFILLSAIRTYGIRVTVVSRTGDEFHQPHLPKTIKSAFSNNGNQLLESASKLLFSTMPTTTTRRKTFASLKVP